MNVEGERERDGGGDSALTRWVVVTDNGGRRNGEGEGEGERFFFRLSAHTQSTQDRVICGDGVMVHVELP